MRKRKKNEEKEEVEEDDKEAKVYDNSRGVMMMTMMTWRQHQCETITQRCGNDDCH